eukprot:4696036-Prymnesium_polylepis.1
MPSATGCWRVVVVDHSRALAAVGLTCRGDMNRLHVHSAQRRLALRSFPQPCPPSHSDPTDTVLPRPRRRVAWSADRVRRELRDSTF